MDHLQLKIKLTNHNNIHTIAEKPNPQTSNQNKPDSTFNLFSVSCAVEFPVTSTCNCNTVKVIPQFCIAHPFCADILITNYCIMFSKWRRFHYKNFNRKEQKTAAFLRLESPPPLQKKGVLKSGKYSSVKIDLRSHPADDR